MEKRGAKAPTRPAAGRYSLLSFLTGGHGIIHWYAQGFFVLLPEVKRDLGLGAVEVGVMMGVRQVAAGAVNLPAGLISDLFRGQGPLILAASMAWVGIAYVLVGLAPTFALLLPAMAMVGAGGAAWHPPAMAALSHRFTERRGMALGLHGVGGSVGDTLAPVAVGAVLAVLLWRQVLFATALPALALAFLVGWSLRGMGEQEGGRPSLGGYLAGLRALARSRPLLALVAAAGVRGMGHTAFMTFFPIYLREPLALPPALVGLYITLLTLMGIGAQPLLGALSDRLGRKTVLVPGLLAMAGLTVGVVGVPAGLPLGGVVVLMGVFFYSLQAVFLAGAMDLSGKGVEATTVGLLFGANFFLASISPVVAGAVHTRFSFEGIFAYVAALFALSALMTVALPLPKPATTAQHA